MRRTYAGAAALVAAALLLAGCSGSDESGDLPEFGGSSGSGASTSTPEPSTSPSSSGPSTSPTTSAALEGADQVTVDIAAPPAADAAEVFTAYVEFWQADVAALARSDADWQPLLDRVSGEQRGRTLTLIRGNAAKQQRAIGAITIRPQVLVVRGDAATVQDCLDLSQTRAVDQQGEDVPGTRGSAAASYTVAMVRVGSQWTVSNIQNSNSPGCG